jgi:amino acid transporter
MLKKGSAGPLPHGRGSVLSPQSEPGALRRELGLRDLTLYAIACIVGTRWIAAAAHSGPGSVTLWLLAAVFFVAPLAVAVAALTVKYPGAGGLYLWTRGDFGPWHGFLCFWVYWMGIAFWFPGAAMFYMSVAVYTLGPSYEHLANNRIYLMTASLAAIWVALGSNLVGLKVGKWTQNLGGIATWVMGVVLAAVAVLVAMKRGAATPLDLMPKWNWDTVSFWATIAYGMTGLELVGLMGAEIRDPQRTVPRAGWIASAFATAFYVGTTIAMLVLLRPENISELNGLAQAGETSGHELGVVWLSPLIALLVSLTALGQIGGLGTGVSRLPFAAGVDHLLPRAFSRIHPKWGTPHVSILVLGAVSSFLLIAIQLGDTMRAAYQELISLMVITGFIPYLYIFGSAWKVARRFSALSGWAITVMALICSVVPTAEIKNVWLFEGKLAIGTVAVIGSAWVVYRSRV